MLMLNPLRYFVEVARCGSIRGASERLHVASSAISRHIMIFEEDVGTPLFERHSRGMVVTAAGELYLRYAQGVLSEGDSTQLEIDALKGMRRGHVRIWSIEGMVAGPLFDSIFAFRKRFPKMTFNVISADTRSVMEAVRDSEADIGIAFQSSPVIGVRIASRIPNPLHAICTQKHELGKRKSLTLDDIAKFTMAIPDRSFGIRGVLDAAFHVHEIRADVAFESNSVEALRAFARSGCGLTVLPWLACKNDILAKRVVAVPIADAMLSASSVDICVREERMLPPAVAEFLEEVTTGSGFNPPEMNTTGNSSGKFAQLKKGTERQRDRRLRGR
ncbi:LysR family transcriptional regulator [Tardiphaga sp. 172_B4_N1_3]|uniref:LysR family transcriptional regulator n=1 Tax=Tardiphaga sp. 172_B4_N1_3 TaxID=3240787 RepID=UPI003F8A7EBB